MGNYYKKHKTCTQSAIFDQGPNTTPTTMESKKQNRTKLIWSIIWPEISAWILLLLWAPAMELLIRPFSWSMFSKRFWNKWTFQNHRHHPIRENKCKTYTFAVHLEGDNLIGAFSISQHKLKESLLNIDEPKIFCETRPWLPTAFKKNSPSWAICNDSFCKSD